MLIVSAPLIVLVAVVQGLGGKLLRTILSGWLAKTGSVALKLPARVRIGLSSTKRPLTDAVETRLLSQLTLSVPLIVLTLHGLGGKVVIIGRSRLRLPKTGASG